MKLIPSRFSELAQKEQVHLFLTIVLGAAGGWIFSLIDAPLPWMLGPMFVIGTVALFGNRPVIPNRLRALVSAVIGLMLGSSFTPDMVGSMVNWIPSLCALVLISALTTAVVAVYLLKVGRYDPVSAYFSSAPGGLSDMTIIGGAMGGNETLISLSHTIRLLIVVSFIPLWFRFSYGYVNPGLTSAMGSLLELRGMDVVVLAGCAVGGFLLARLAHLPAPYMMGPLLLSAVVHGTGLTQAHPPGELVIAAQIILGSAIGCRFAGIRWRSMIRPIIVSCVATLIMLLCNLIGVLGLWWIIRVNDFPSLFLSFTPGGLAEMSMIGISLGADIAFISTHHFLRIFSVLFLAPFIFNLLPAFAKALQWFRRS